VRLYQTTDPAITDEKVNSMVEISELETRRAEIQNLFDMRSAEMVNLGFTDWNGENGEVYEQCTETIDELKDWRAELIDFAKRPRNDELDTALMIQGQQRLNGYNATIAESALSAIGISSLQSYEDTFEDQILQLQKQLGTYLTVIIVSIALMVISVAIIVASYRKKKCYC